MIEGERVCVCGGGGVVFKNTAALQYAMTVRNALSRAVFISPALDLMINPSAKAFERQLRIPHVSIMLMVIITNEIYSISLIDGITPCIFMSALKGSEWQYIKYDI